MRFNDTGDRAHFINDTRRQIYAGMLLELDYAVGNVTEALERNGMFHEHTVLVLTSDNGGPGQGGSPPNNLPLRGGKACLWEGGVRVLGFVTSPSLPAARRNTTFDGMVHATGDSQSCVPVRVVRHHCLSAVAVAAVLSHVTHLL